MRDALIFAAGLSTPWLLLMFLMLLTDEREEAALPSQDTPNDH